jgi:type II secretory pathway pseudopilin PulG
MKASRFTTLPVSGFSLIEVTLALGIVAFGLISILGAYGSLQSRSSNSDMRDNATFAVNSIQNYLQGQKEFEVIFDKIKEGNLELVFFNYRGAEPDQPDVLGDNLYSYCAELDSDWKNWETPRYGKMFRAVLELDETVNPVKQSELGAEANEYAHGYLALQLSLYDVYGFHQAMSSSDVRRSVLTTTMVITR